MIKMFFVFLILCILISSSISLFRAMTNRERWEFTKILAYGIMVSGISTLVLVGIVILF